MAKLLLVEQYFYPDGWGGAEIPRDIATGLRKAGFDVDVLCSKDQYAPLAPDEMPEDPRSFGIRIFRVPRIFPGPIHRFKFLRIVWFCAYALPRLLFHRGVDLYVTQTNPLLIVPTVAIVSALRRKPFVIVAQDLYPEALFASGLAAPDSLPGRCLQRLFSWSYRRASAVVALGTFMRRRILEKGVSPHRVHTISNWATGDIRLVAACENPLRAEWGLGDRFVVLYSGNMGVGHEFETFLGGVQLAAKAGAIPPSLHFESEERARQLVDDGLTRGILEHRPAADLVDRALAAEAEAALAIDRADADAGRHHAPERWWSVRHGVIRASC